MRSSRVSTCASHAHSPLRARVAQMCSELPPDAEPAPGYETLRISASDAARLMREVQEQKAEAEAKAAAEAEVSSP